jgi:ribosome-associated protein
VTPSDSLALQLAALADSKLAEEIVVLDMRDLVSYTDYLVICTARNERQLNAVIDEVRLRLKQDEGLIPGQTEGGGGAGWAVLDYLDCVLHVFTPDARRRYDLEELWRDAPRVELPESADSTPRSATA